MSSSESSKHRRALGGILREVHQQAALKAIRGFGFAIDKWDPQAVGRFDPDGNITDDNSLALVDVRYKDTPRQAAILGHSHFLLNWSGAPLSYSERLIPLLSGQSHTQHDVAVIDAAPKMFILTFPTAKENLQTVPPRCLSGRIFCR
jgi:hypothetical protein